jgi:hypothetical protein
MSLVNQAALAAPLAEGAPAATAAAAPSAPGWIVSARYDTLFFTGSLLAPALLWAGFQLGWLTGIAVFAIFQLAFNLPHNFQTWTLTLLDARDRARNARRYALAAAGVTLIFVVPLFVSPDTVFPWVRDLLLYWGYYHLVRQHYGFQRLYERKLGGVSARESFWYARFLDAISYLPLLLRFRDRDLMTIHAPGADVWLRHPLLPRAAVSALLVLYAGILAAALLHHLRMAARGRRNLMPRALLFLSVTVAFGAAALVREFLVAVALVTAFHNLQYIGLVWFHNSTRAEREGSGAAEGNLPVGWIARGRLPLYVATSLLYGVAVFAPLAIFPDKPWAQVPITLVVALHYYVDGRAWRFKDVPERALYLKLRG